MNLEKVSSLLQETRPLLLLENYRPVTVPCSLTRDFKHILNRKNHFLEHHKILIQNQHCFIQKKSAITVILCLYYDIFKYIEAVECPAVMFCDQSEAFDCVSYAITFYLLYRRGIQIKTPRLDFFFFKSPKAICFFQLQ